MYLQRQCIEFIYSDSVLNASTATELVMMMMMMMMMMMRIGWKMLHANADGYK
jgi:hypothetical protein